MSDDEHELTQDEWTALRIQYLRNLNEVNQITPQGKELLKRLETRLTETDFDLLLMHTKEVLMDHPWWDGTTGAETAIIAIAKAIPALIQEIRDLRNQSHEDEG